MSLASYNNYRFVVDLEATCFENPKKPDINEIIEIGIVLCDADYNILYKWSSFVQPKINRHLSNFCKKLTSIKQFEIDQAMQFVDVAQLFQKEFETRYGIDTRAVIWCTWGDWDLKCLIDNCKRHEIEMPFGEYQNLRTIYINKRNDGINNKCGLREVLVRENLDPIPKHHRALIDAEAAARIAKFIR